MTFPSLTATWVAGAYSRGSVGGENLLIHIIQPNGQLSAPNPFFAIRPPPKIRGPCHERAALKVNYMIVIINTDWFRMVRRLRDPGVSPFDADNGAALRAELGMSNVCFAGLTGSYAG